MLRRVSKYWFMLYLTGSSSTPDFGSGAVYATAPSAEAVFGRVLYLY